MLYHPRSVFLLDYSCMVFNCCSWPITCYQIISNVFQLLQVFPFFSPPPPAIALSVRIVTFAIVKWTYGVPLDISILSDYHYFIIFLPPPIPSSSPLQWGLSPPFVYGGDGEDCDNRRWKQCSVLIDAYIPSLLYYFLFLCLSLLPLPPPPYLVIPPSFLPCNGDFSVLPSARESVRIVTIAMVMPPPCNGVLHLLLSSHFRHLFKTPQSVEHRVEKT